MVEGVESIGELKGQALRWVQPKASKRQYELVAGPRVYATVTWQKPLGSLAVCRTSENSYSLKRMGFLHPRVTVRRLDFDDDIAVLRMDFGGGGTLEFNDGRVFRLSRKGFWNSVWDISDEGHRQLCSLTWVASLSKKSGEVSIESEVKKLRDPALLLCVAWYTMVLAAEESAAVAVIPALG